MVALRQRGRLDQVAVAQRAYQHVVHVPDEDLPHFDVSHLDLQARKRVVIIIIIIIIIIRN